MLTASLPRLTADEIDDVLYLTRVNEAQEVQQIITELAKKYECDSQLVIEAAVDSHSGNTALHYCAANGLAELLRALLSKEQKNQDVAVNSARFVNRQNKEGNSPLHWASLNGHLAVVKLLISEGADMWIKNGAGHLAMFEAERAEKADVVRYLLEAGGKEVEQVGMEAQPSADDITEVQATEPSQDVQAETEVNLTGGNLRSNG